MGLRGKMGERANKVDATSLAYDRMAQDWDLIHDLLGGTRAMRAAGEKWLLREPAEEHHRYQVRLNRSILFNGYKDARDRIVSKPFSKDVVVEGALPESLQPVLEDVDGTGKSFNQLAREVMTAGLTYGKTHVLVDFARMPEGATLEEERQRGARPAFIHVQSPQLFAWRSDTGSQGQETLDHVRIMDRRTEPVGEWGEQEVDLVRVYGRDYWQLWRKSEADGDEEFKLIEHGSHTFGEVPLVTMYFARTGFMLGEPPLGDLAWMNLAHWQSYSDQRNVLRFSRCGMMLIKGIPESEREQGFTVGPNSVIITANENADGKYVEHSGQGIAAGQIDLDRIEERMQLLRMQPFVQRSGNETATGRAIDQARSMSDVSAWVRAEETGLLEVLDLGMRWTNGTLPEDVTVDIFSDFGLSQRSAEEIDNLIKMRMAREISRETFLIEVKRRGLLSDLLDIEEELIRIEEEKPDMAELGFGSDSDDGEDDDTEEEEENGGGDNDEDNLPPRPPAGEQRGG